jgi:hypothetical protein
MSYHSFDVVSIIAMSYEKEIMSALLKMTLQDEFCRMEQTG